MMPGFLIKEALQFLRSTTPASVTIVQHINDGFRTIMMDPVQLQQLLVNLFSNAVRAIDESGTIEVKGTIVELDENDVAGRQNIQPGNYFRLTVSDAGDGMDRATQERMFDYFYTTPELAEGTGMGLATVMGCPQPRRSYHGGQRAWIRYNHSGIFSGRCIGGKPGGER